ncbi:hypothetical protein ACWGOQ_0011805 [Aquimarina sp. M1]
MIKFLLTISIFLYTHFLIAQETYRDEFGVVSYTNNDGTSNWAGNWVEVEPFDVNDNPAGGFIAILGNQLDFNWIWTETITRSVNIAGATLATLSFDWETISLDANEELSIQVSDDGTTFTTLASFGGTQTGSFSQNISLYISANTTIRFVNTNANWTDSGDIVIIDNVQIEATFPDDPPVVAVTGDRYFCANASNSVPIVETISITDPDDANLEQLTIQISTGYQNGSDLLTLTGIHPNITDSWDVTEGRLILTGPATLAEFEAAVLATFFRLHLRLLWV